MKRIDRYLLRELYGAFAAVLLVLLLVSMSGLVADLLGKVARGKVPAGLMLSQLGLRLVDALPLLLPLSLFLAVLLGISRLYRDSEMAVLASAGVGPSRLLRAVGGLAVPVFVVVLVVSLWMAPAALRTSQRMIEEANRSLLVAGLEPGRFMELPGRHSVVYLADMSPDGSSFQRLFVHTERNGREDVVTARSGELFAESQGDERYLSLRDGFRVEGDPASGEYRTMRFARNDIRVPDSEPADPRDAERRVGMLDLLATDGAPARAELHWRLATPIAVLMLALLALPLGRQPPRASRYGSLLLALLLYLVYFNGLTLGRAALASETLPGWLGLWWLHLPLLGIALWLLRDELRGRRRQVAA